MNWGFILTSALYTAVSVQSIGYILAAIGLNVHFGFTGLLNFGQAVFAAAGAYAIAVPVAHYGWSIWEAIPMVFVVAIVLSLLFGIPTLRLRADYLAIVTIAAAEIVRLILTSAYYSKLFGGAEGLQKFTTDLENVNPFSAHRFAPFGTCGPLKGLLRCGSGTQSFGEYDLFIMIIGWSLVAIVSIVVYLLVRSPWGRALKSIREDEDAARSLGKNVFAYKLQSLALGGVIGAFGGVILAVGGRSASPNDYSTAFTFFAWTVMILGGVGKVKGPIIGGLIYWFILGFVENFLAQATREKLLPHWLVTNNNFGLWRFMLTGLGLAVLVIFRPQGVFGDRREQAFDVR
jgi:branched-chain amino acid transport system permease protein